MSEVTVTLDKVSKRYRLSRGGHGSLRSELASGLRRLVRRSEQQRGVYWALKDASCEMERGDVVGFIGPNGAGKSTILKVLSRVTSPTSGSFKTRGRVGALIEIGAGFHPQLTGRDTISLTGSILGMRRREIDEKLDRIISFAEIEQFIDTPIKYYSSGMQVRLRVSAAGAAHPGIPLFD